MSVMTTELWSPHGGVQCLLTSTTGDHRGRHSQQGLLMCGGSPGLERDCSSLDTVSGQLVASHNLTQERRFHVSWATRTGVILYGGTASPDTAEIVKAGGVVAQMPGYFQHSRE